MKEEKKTKRNKIHIGKSKTDVHLFARKKILNALPVYITILQKCFKMAFTNPLVFLVFDFYTIKCNSLYCGIVQLVPVFTKNVFE